jgi:hypothetical protein
MSSTANRNVLKLASRFIKDFVDVYGPRFGT